MIKDLSAARIVKILQNNYTGSLGFIAHKSPYVLPVTYYFDPEHKAVISYATEGHKTRAMRESPKVSLLVVEQDSPDRWRSVLAHGVYEELHQIDAKFYLKEFSTGVSKLLESKGIATPSAISEFSSKSDLQTDPLVYRIRISDWTGKYREG